MRKVLLTLAVLAGLGLAGAAAVVGFGLYNVSAQVGHLPGVSWVLHTTFRNSVRLRAPAPDEVPPLDDPDLIALGAGHYATACVDCHGALGQPRSATVRAMVPVPPPIDEAVAHWRPNELHWIVENGVKMSGMPAWPVQDRGDEVWAVVAYLVSVQEGASPEIPSPDLAGLDYCQSCHGRIGGPVPRLDILSEAYIGTQLDAYLTGLRPSGIMAQAASRVPQARFDELARAFVTQSGPAGAGAGPDLGDIASTEERETGAELARLGTRDVPACLACHGGEPAREAAKGPRLFGQSRAYLAAQLELWRDGVYSHDDLMAAAARDLSDADIAAVSAFFAAADP
ncbi:c-type cytochrome [Maritimibacter sp. DP1N21-5]|uniref:c-type cytochrome n=1 Tax=Maritimibacter sp. DP1N21-5 TaxID=2836867 RepID=UPI001C47214E|nr:c-type cytochrome [Maritimibacter sp. DP1N21-5]MBV7410732.1 c-type cytochrome [Maritimibacter sp. DP1N21-5]